MGIVVRTHGVSRYCQRHDHGPEITVLLRLAGLGLLPVAYQDFEELVKALLKRFGGEVLKSGAVKKPEAS